MILAASMPIHLDVGAANLVAIRSEQSRWACMLMEEEREIRYVVVDATGRSTFVYAPGQPHQPDDGQGLNQLLIDGWQTISQTKFIDDDEQTEEPCSLILLAKAG